MATTQKPEVKPEQQTKQAGFKRQPELVEKIIRRVQKTNYRGIIRYRLLLSIEDAMDIIFAIGRKMTPDFTIDDENRFTYENFVKWLHCDPTMCAIDPETRSVCRGGLKKGIYISGNTGSGKSMCVDIMRIYAQLVGVKIYFPASYDEEKSPLLWKTLRADEICEIYLRSGDIKKVKDEQILCIQDFGQEPQESVYMGNRMGVMRQLLEYRGDQGDQITIITSNLKINGDNLVESYGERVKSRLAQMCNWFEIKGKDRRK